MSTERILELVGSVYDCALDPSGWPVVLEGIAGLVDGINASISVQDPMLKQARFSTTWRVPDGPMTLYNERYAAINPVMTSGWYCEIDQPISAARYVGEEAYFTSRYAREFLAPLGWGDAIGSHLMKLQNRYGILAVFGPWDRGAFGDRDLDTIRQIAPHVRRAVTIADLLDSRSVHAGMMSAALDLVSVGILLVDEHSRIVHLNAAARVHVEGRTALRRVGDHIAARDPKSAHNLRDAIATAASGTTVTVPRSGIEIPILASNGEDLAAWVLPLDTGLRREFAAPFSAKVAVFVRRLGDTTAFPGELFVKRYGITPGECRVLMMLVQGLSVTETCDALGIGEPTVKTHMSRLFAKTGTSGQADLMRLAVSALAPAMASPAAGTR